MGTATENGIPSTNAPQPFSARRARKRSTGSGSRIQPGHIRPSRTKSGPSTNPHSRPRSFCTHCPPSPAAAPRNTWVSTMPAMNMAPKRTARRVSWALVT